MSTSSKQAKKRILNRLRDEYSKPEYLKSDPIEIVYNYKNPLDQECVALITALFSYGNVRAIRNFLQNLFNRLAYSPYQTLSKTKDFDELVRSIGGYRFQKEKDIAEFLFGISELIRESKLQLNQNNILPNKDSLENVPLFEKYFLDNGIIGFQSKLRSKLRFQSYGLDFLVGKALAKSAHKRYSMFLRWMVLATFPDLYFYQSLSEYDLVFPLDTHIIRMAKILNLTNRKSNDRKMAEEITSALTDILGEPSVRFDFALSRIGIMEKCRGKYDENICPQCKLRTVCTISLSR